MTIAAYIFFGIFFILVVVAIVTTIQEKRQFRPGHNPANRVCKDCGGVQHQYYSPALGGDTSGWWEKASPSKEGCACNKYAQISKF